MKFFKKVSYLNAKKHSPEVQQTYHQIQDHMTTGTRILQGTYLVLLFVSLAVLACILFGLVSIQLIITDIVLIILTMILYHRFCYVMARRLQKRH